MKRAMGMAMTAFWLTAASAGAAPTDQMPAGALQAAIQHLPVTGRVLYVAAHPDDENTRLLTWLARDQGLTTAYLSITRGDGGQNLIGPEQSDLFGVIRTRELLEARRLDGAIQFFTRAVDFGYCKSPEEALATWGEEETLGDVVRVIRRFQPDIIITRFPESGPTHGHHTASARLARAAFKAAADASKYPDQLEGPDALTVWRADRLLYNVPTWRRPPNDPELAKFLKIDVGGYDPLLGRSYGEIAAASRSMHKSQGFGVSARRGPITEHFEPLEGTRPSDHPLAGLDFTMNRYKGAPGTHPASVERAAEALAAVAARFDPAAPEKAIPALVSAHNALSALPRRPWRLAKQAQIEALIVSCAGLYLEATSNVAAAAPGGPVEISAEALLRRPVEIALKAIKWPGSARVKGAGNLTMHFPHKRGTDYTVPAGTAPTTAWWLTRANEGGRYRAPHPDLIGRPEGPPALEVEFELSVDDLRFRISRPVMHTWTDPVQGQQYRRFEVIPPITVTPEAPMVLLSGGPRVVTLFARGVAEGVQGRVGLDVPKGYKVVPASAQVSFKRAGEVRRVSFEITPPANATDRVTAQPFALVDGRRSSWRVAEVGYPHIPAQTILRPSGLDLVPVKLKPEAAGRVGYVPGVGGRVVEHLKAVGVQITTLDEAALATADLSGFAAIAIGPRAFNAHPELYEHLPRLLAWVEAGGTLVVQYQTHNWISKVAGSVGPWPLKIGRGRVTDQTAPITALVPDHPALTGPHALGEADYAGWVQERGLYFAEAWDDRYTPLFSLADGQEDARLGSTLVTRHGKGGFVYTGLSFFRQIPAGVPGAYRLLINLLAWRPGGAR